MDNRVHPKNLRFDRSPTASGGRKERDAAERNNESAFEGRFKATRMVSFGLYRNICFVRPGLAWIVLIICRRRAEVLSD